MKRPTLHTLLASAVLIVISFAGLLLAQGAALGADPNKLRDGASVLRSMQRNHSPEVNKFLDGVINDKLPPRAPGSGLTPVDAKTDPSVLRDPENVFVKNRDGSISYISKQRLQEGLQEVANVVTRRSDFDQIFKDGISIVPPGYRRLVDILNDTIKLVERSPLGIITSRSNIIRKHGTKIIVKEIVKNSDGHRQTAWTVVSAPPGPPPPPTVTPTTPTPPPTTTPAPPTTVTPAKPPAPDCTKEEAALANAKSNIAAGQLGAAETALRGIDLKKCHKLATDVANAQQQITDKVAELNRKAAAAMSSCDQSMINDAATALSGASHPGLTTARLTARAQALSGATTSFEQARSSYLAGNLAASRTKLNALRASMSTAGIQNCEPYNRAGNALATIERMDSVLAQANAAANTCDLVKINRMIAQLQQRKHVLLRQALQRLNAAKTECEKKQVGSGPRSAADQRCIDQYGPNSYSAQSSADGINICKCRDPYTFNFDRTRCVDPGQVMAEANASCQERYGPDAYADPDQSTYKTYVCNCGGNSVWNCDKTRCVNEQKLLSSLRTKANVICKRKYGKRLRNVKVYRSCKYDCVVRKKTKKRPPRTTKRDRKPPKRKHDTSVSVAVGIGVGIGIGRGTKKRRRPSCHHQKSTTKQHCGSN